MGREDQISGEASPRRPGPETGSRESHPVTGVRIAGWAVVALLFFGLVVWPLWKGRFYGFGQVIFYCILLALAAWVIHWTHRVLIVRGDRILLASPVHERSLKLDGVRCEVRRGWWTRVVLIPAFGLPTSLISPLWRPDPARILERHLPGSRFLVETDPSLDGPGPAERDSGPDRSPESENR